MAQRSTRFCRLTPALFLPLVLLFSAMALPMAGADEKKPSTPFEGFSSDNDKPVNVKADSLEMHQEDQMAIFTGNVVATQGDSVLTSNELTVYYEAADADGTKNVPASDAAQAAPASTDAQTASTTAAAPAAAAAEPANKVKRLVAKGNVVVTATDQKATGDDGVLDMETNIATMTGEEVVMSQGCNVLKGKKLVVNTKTGLANVTGGTTGHFISGGDQQKC
jgi:lipopolysaccharide export system protein LptA